jgi:pimeloyl-ACP methyl ester carboxylesterase
VAVDLRGHGRSDAPLQEYTIHGFADDLAWTSGELGVSRAVVVGHSMGGLTALILAGEQPELVRAAVLIDAPVLLPPDALALRRPILETFWGPDYVNAVVAYANDRFFIDTDDPERRALILEGIAAMPQHVLASAWQSILETDSVPATRVAGERGLPILSIGAARPLADVVRLRELCPQAMVAQTAGAGHFCQLEVPEQVNAMIERFLKVAV